MSEENISYITKARKYLVSLDCQPDAALVRGHSSDGDLDLFGRFVSLYESPKSAVCAVYPDEWAIDEDSAYMGFWAEINPSLSRDSPSDLFEKLKALVSSKGLPKGRLVQEDSDEISYDLNFEKGGILWYANFMLRENCRIPCSNWAMPSLD